MPLEIIRNDISRMNVDALVNPTNPDYQGDGGADLAIHRLAGPELLEECLSLGRIRPGEAKITGAYGLASKYVIHILGPKWIDGKKGEEKLLADSYRNSLLLAKEQGLETIAFPLISSGAHGFPKDRALRIAIDTIGDFLLANDMMVYLLVYDKKAFQLSEKLFTSIKEYIDDNYVEGNGSPARRRSASYELDQIDYRDSLLIVEQAGLPREEKERSLEDIIRNLDESFSQMLLRLIDQKSMTDAETYKKANIDRRHFSKIRNDVDYKPSKATSLAFAIALELNLDETKDLLQKAGFALSPSDKFDLIIEYFIDKGNYNIFEINEALFAFDQKLLGF